MMRTRLANVIGGALLLAAVFITVSYFARMNQGALASFVEMGGVAGMVALVLLQAFCTVFFVPLDSTVLVPLATHAWGPFATATMSIIGWTIGSAIAFLIARRLGRPAVERMIGVQGVAQANERAPRTHLFWWALLSQAFIQVDFVSYMFGLFTEIRFGTYVLATAIGDVFPAFFFSYAGTLPVWYGAAAVTGGLLITGLLFWRAVRAS